MNKRISYTKPSIAETEISYALDAVTNGWGANCYDYISRFEAAFKSHLGISHAIATSSCTGALHLGLSGLSIGQGDEVILADTNWIATAAPLHHLGARPVLVDILTDTWCIDPQAVENAVTSKTKAIIATHIYGNLCDMDSLLEIANKHNLVVIEDSAEAIGSVYKGRKAGTIGEFATFSFHGSKTITTGEGGMFVTNNDKLYEKVLTLSNHGRSSTQVKQFWPDMIGFKYKMSNIQAAIGLGQVERINELISRKQEILQLYRTILLPSPFIRMNPVIDGSVSGAWMPNIVFNEDLKIKREEILKGFQDANIDARVFFWPLTELGFFEQRTENLSAQNIAKRAINLPSYHDIAETDIRSVCDVIKKLIEKKIEVLDLK